MAVVSLGVDITKNDENEFGLVVDDAALLQTKTVEFTASQTNTVLISGKAGYIVEVRALIVNASGNSGEITIGFDSGNFFKMYVAKQDHMAVSDINIKGDEGEDLKITTTTGTDAIYVGINYIMKEAQ